MPDYKPRNMLVTGGAGFIGCNFVRYMLETDRQIKITNLDLLTYAGSLDNLKNLPDKVNGAAREGALGCEKLINFVTDRPGHDWRYTIDTTKVNDKLDWQSAETFEIGIRETIEWHLSILRMNR